MMLLAALSSTAVLATGDQKPGIGNNEARLLLTRCSNAGDGNGPEYEKVGAFLSLTFIKCDDSCLGKKYDHLSYGEVLAVFQQGYPECEFRGYPSPWA